MPTPAADLREHLLNRLRQVQEALGTPGPAADAQVRFADAVDSMGLVEFVALIAEDCGVTPEALEQAAGRRFGTVAELADALADAGLRPGAGTPRPVAAEGRQDTPVAGPASAWLAATAVGLPVSRQSASALGALLQRPPAWLEEHAGIHGRCVWEGEDILEVAARTARNGLERAGVTVPEVGVLLACSEAPPVLVGLAAALHHRLGLRADAVALEVGGACTGFVAALWLARRLLPGAGPLLVLAVEAPTRLLGVRPGPGGEAAALFGDGTAACVLTASAAGPDALPLADVVLGADGGAGSLLQVRQDVGGAQIDMDGPALAGRAVRTMAQAVRDLAGRHGLEVGRLGAVVAHGGNGRLPGLLARQLGIPAEKVWSQTAHAGNLGSASLPVAWAARPTPADGPVVWTAVGAGLTWGAALLGAPSM